jgi:small subunit ribosomal protein S17
VNKNTQNKMEKKEKKQNEVAKTVGAVCKDIDCHEHGNLKVRGKTFGGMVIKKFPRRITIEFERMVYVRKYERYAKSKTKIHTRLPDCMKDSVNVGDYVRVQECRPLSKIIHFAFIQKLKNVEDKK